MDPNDSEVSAEGPGGFKIRARGTDAVVGVGLIAVSVFGYVLWTHMNDTKVAAQELAKELREGVKVQKFTACIIATKEEQKEAQYSNPQSFCNRMAQ